MSYSPVTMEATLQPDGQTLQLDKKIPLSPGRVMVTVQVSSPSSGPTMLEVLNRIYLDEQRRGRRPMTEEEMEAEIAAMRADDDEAEKRWKQIWSQTSKPTQPLDKP